MRLLFLFLLSGFALYASQFSGIVVKVIDGDSIIVKKTDGDKEEVRLDRTDAPEYNQDFGQQSRFFLDHLIYKKKVTVKYKKHDSYDRVLGIVFYGKIEVNLQMIQKGMSWHYSYYDQTKSYAAAQVYAQKNKLGLWGASAHPQQPYLYRKSHK
ncbi:MAG: thermonuclease family protein [Lentisphaeria bacterium]